MVDIVERAILMVSYNPSLEQVLINECNMQPIQTGKCEDSKADEIWNQNSPCLLFATRLPVLSKCEALSNFSVFCVHWKRSVFKTHQFQIYQFSLAYSNSSVSQQGSVNARQKQISFAPFSHEYGEVSTGPKSRFLQ